MARLVIGSGAGTAASANKPVLRPLRVGGGLRLAIALMDCSQPGAAIDGDHFRLIAAGAESSVRRQLPAKRCHYTKEQAAVQYLTEVPVQPVERPSMKKSHISSCV